MRSTSFQRDGRGRPTRVSLADGRPEEQQISITWDANVNAPAVIERPGLTTTRVFDASGLLTSVTEADSTSHTAPYPTNGQTRTWSYTYTTGGLVSTIDGPLPGAGDTVAYSYDSEGYVETFTNELGHVTTVLSVNGRGLPTSVEDPNGLVTHFSYDAMGRLLDVTADPAGVSAVTSFDYDPSGNVTKVTEPDGSYLVMTYDDSSRVVTMTNALGDNAVYTYDGMGNLISQEVSNGFPQLFFRWQQSFDELGRLMDVTGVGPATWHLNYDKVGNLTSVLDPNGEAATMAYDGLNRLIAFADERSSVTTSSYGATREPATVTDPRSVTTTYVRNGWGEVIQEQSNDIGAIVLERNPLGDVTKRTDARGVVTEYTHDDAGRLTSVTYPGEPASDVVYSYDSVVGGNHGIGRLTGVADAAGTVSYVYDLLGRVVEETRVIGSQSYAVAYERDAAGNVENMTYPSGRIVFYDRDAAGEIEVVRTRPAGGSTSWLVQWVGRTPFGPRSGVLFGNGMREWRRYDQDGRITALETLVEPTSTYLIDWTYAYTDKRNLTDIKDFRVPANDEVYTYTDNGFLETGQGPWGQIAYVNDGVGNRTQKVTTTGTTSTDVIGLVAGANRLAGVTTDGTPSRSFQSDAAGNIVEDDDLVSSVTRAYTWNHPGLLAGVEVNSSAVGAYTYDYLSRLVSRALPAASVTVHRVHDLDGNVIAEYDAGGDLLTEYVWLEERPVAVIDHSGVSPETSFVHTDHLERPVMMTDAGATVVWRAAYLPFGEVASLTGPATLNYRFPGQWFQLESGLHYNWHRHYDPTTGRYLQPDPLGMPDGPSRWAYVRNSPLMEVDPEGEFAQFVPIIFGIVLGAGLEYFTNPCATWIDLAVAGGIGGLGGAGGMNAYRLTRLTGVRLERSHVLPSRYFRPLTKRAKRPNPEYKPWLPKGLKDSPLNINMATPRRHYRHDPTRSPAGSVKMGKRLLRPLQLLDRTPDWLKGATVGSAVGAGMAGD